MYRRVQLFACVILSHNAAAQSCADWTVSATPLLTGPLPVNSCLSDVDSDGDMDLLVYFDGSSDESLDVFLNNGDGSFASPLRFFIGKGVRDLALGDLDDDGDLDIAAPFRHSTGLGDEDGLSVMLNNGDGSFADRVVYSTWQNPSHIVIGDLDSDGDLDIAVANSSSGNVGVYINSGPAVFAPVVVYGSGQTPRSLDIGDADNDGDLDLVVVRDGSNGVGVMLNNGNGTFNFPLLVAGSGSHWPKDASVADMNSDGVLDIVVANAGRTNNVPPESIGVFLGNGDATYQAILPFAQSAGTFFNVLTQDIDGDGHIDAMATQGSNEGRIVVLTNDGSGALQFQEQVILDFFPGGESLADIDGDSDIDLVIANVFYGEMQVVVNQCAPQDCPADLTGDGTLDFFDISAFLTAFGNQDPVADFTGDGSFDFFDISTFLTAFSAGCP